MTIHLKGITWSHSRGYVSVVAAAQRYTETHSGVEIDWDKRSLQEFADAPIHKLAETYDLLVIDHPWAGFAADKHVLVPLEQVLPEDYLADQAANSVGKSYESYTFGSFQSALAIDAATPVASYRPDILNNAGHSLPETWKDVLSLAKKGKVIFPAIPIDTLMNFYMLCSTQGEDPCVQPDTVVSREMGLKVLEQLRELAGYCNKEIFNWNPIKVYEAMSNCNDFIYCPFAYGYSNYSRAGYSRYLLKFTDMVSIENHGRLQSTIGGTGLAVSAKCDHIKEAAAFAQYAASSQCQKTIFFESGGQPGHRSAWLDAEVNRRTLNFFKDTLPAIDRGYMRPRYSGYLHFQDNAGDVVRAYIRDGGDPVKVLEQMDRLYMESKRGDSE